MLTKEQYFMVVGDNKLALQSWAHDHDARTKIATGATYDALAKPAV